MVAGLPRTTDLVEVARRGVPQPPQRPQRSIEPNSLAPGDRRSACKRRTCKSAGLSKPLTSRAAAAQSLAKFVPVLVLSFGWNLATAAA